MTICYPINKSYEEFTESEYGSLIRTAKLHWQFISYSDHATIGPAILWRHDIDFSVHRAYALAKIDASEGVTSTYFILLHGAYYNPLENEVTKIIKTISEMGHALGLHFDPAFYGTSINTASKLSKMLEFEKHILNRTFETRIQAFSLHNPTIGKASSIEDDEIAGMVNAYGRTITAKYSYVSDSNGIWRHRHLRDVLEGATDHYLQVLTHPEWWVTEPMPPRDRIIRSINGRAKSALMNYDQLLEVNGRPNIGIPGIDSLDKIDS